MSESRKPGPTLRIFAVVPDEPGSLNCTLCKKPVQFGSTFAVVTESVCICDHSIASLAVQYLQFVEEKMLNGEVPAVAERFLERLFHETFLARYFAAVGNCPAGFNELSTIVSSVDPLKIDALRQWACDRTFCEEHWIVPVDMRGGGGTWAFRALDEQYLPSLAMWQAALLPAPRVGLPTFVRVNYLDFQALLDRYYPAPVAQTKFEETKTYSQDEVVAAVDQRLYGRFAEDFYLKEFFFPVRLQDEQLVVAVTSKHGFSGKALIAVVNAGLHKKSAIQVALSMTDWYSATMRIRRDAFIAKVTALQEQLAQNAVRH